MTVLSFEQAIHESAKYSARHLLMGNGFSIACRPDIFQYGKLFDQANFEELSSTVKGAFDALGTQDFEKIIKLLRDSKKILATYGVDEAILNSLGEDADALKQILIRTIAKSHPEWPGEISDEEYVACRKFLANFAKKFTLNYDLLLYWALMHTPEGEKPTSDDGFRKSPDDMDADYVVWDSTSAHKQDVYFLHGALHIFDGSTEIQKYTWVNTQKRLIDQIGESLAQDQFPIFVSEGESEEKLERILHSAFLAKGIRSLPEITGCIFIFGHSLAANDEHILKIIERGKLDAVYVGLFGDPESPSNQAIIARAQVMGARREQWNHKRPLQVSYYAAESAQVWGH